MKKNTTEQIHKAFDIARKVYRNEISVSAGANILETNGLKRSSGLDYIYAYSKLLQGKLYTRTINAYSTDYYLDQIHKENGKNGLKTALLALYQHIEYYEGTSGASVKKGREIYEKYYDLVKDDFAETVFPDEVDTEQEYSEGKTRQVIVNSYERNQLARQECIEHFGLNCQVCDFNFEDKFGELGQNFIHVHHIIDIATIGKEYSVAPKKDLVPVCPNCHAMLHKKKPAAYTVFRIERNNK
ncbi:HNH endonuclease [Algoriphagus sp.]|uniref:HNH endonuclease n=1 Tax=Algoriphagus sp. TaxID=1872435 RepID=UPI003F6EEDA7